MSAAQVHRMPNFRGGEGQVKPPVQIFTLQLDGVGPPRYDHA